MLRGGQRVFANHFNIGVWLARLASIFSAGRVVELTVQAVHSGAEGRKRG